jgi:hypothetical protein
VKQLAASLFQPCLCAWDNLGLSDYTVRVRNANTAWAGLIITLVVGLHTAPAADTRATVRFRNAAAQSGLDFVLENSPTERKHLTETMAGGVAAFDYDGDGWTDIYFTNGASVPSLQKEDPKYHNRLFRNLGGLRFRDVTDSSGLAGTGYSTAVAVADFDNDGHPDVFVGGVRENRLYRNEGNGKFKDVTASAGIGSGRWCEGAAWLDYDKDGLLDLFIVNYVEWSPAFDTFCGDRALNVRSYCHPRLFEGLPNALYRNNGDGTLTDVSSKSGIDKHIGKGMSAVVADYDRDGFPDIFVANDKVPNFLFHNLKNGTFEEVGLESGVALQDSGAPVSSMGADFRDLDNDARPDLAFTALAGETFPLFLNTPEGLFRDAGHSARMAPLSQDKSGWGIGAFDFDNDGWKDLFTANGHVNDTVEKFEAAKYKLTNSIFLNGEDRQFRDTSSSAGLASAPPQAHRGSAYADFNNDGRVDVVVVSLGGPVELWENITETKNSWLILKMRGTKSNRDGIGAELRIGAQHNHMTTAVGYLSSSAFGVHFGLGALQKVTRIEVLWPSGTRQVLEDVEPNRVLEVTEP